ncbi:MAG: GrpB family protein [Vulcanimicrobiaceae bacterium]
MAQGYECGHGADHPEDWLYFVKRDADGKRITHLHVVPFEGPFWKRLVAFRDALRGNAELAAEHAALKIGLAAEHGEDRLRYRGEKAAFVERGTAEQLRGGRPRWV